MKADLIECRTDRDLKEFFLRQNYPCLINLNSSKLEKWGSTKNKEHKACFNLPKRRKNP